MNVLYLASPIDGVGGGTAIVNRLRNEALGETHEKGLVVYDPASAWYVGKGQYEPDGRLWEVNEKALEESDGLLAIWPEGVASVGVGMEIGMALKWSKRVAVVGNRRWSFALRAEGIELFGENEVKEAVAYLIS